MNSLLTGFQYDIFISYRHNDNLDGWVTQFVESLEKELRSTLKESLTIYFDKNPQDGLLETHDVDGSLKEKVKCLVFIPIVSQTYCDPKSFAWQKELLAFLGFAKQDQFGLDVKLSNGNIAKRVLPVRIHEIDDADQNLFEETISGVLRPVDFIYKEPGVNRPLKITDDRGTNQSHTDYSNQINKVANAIKEIILSLKGVKSHQPVNPNVQPQDATVSKRSYILVVAFIALLLTVYFIFTRFQAKEVTDDTIEKSIAVLPFVDLSEANDQGWFADGHSEEILNSLAHVNGLKVISRTSSFAFKHKTLRIKSIADSLHVNYVVEGSVRKSNQGLRITAQLIRAKDDFHVWSNTYERDLKDIFNIQQEIAIKIAQSLNITLDSKAVEQMHWAGTQNAEAFLAFLKGRDLDDQAHVSKVFMDLSMLKKANTYYIEAIDHDPDFLNAYLFRADFFLHYILKDDPNFHDTLTDQEAYDMFMNDLNNMVTRSKDESQKNYYRLAQIMYSNDWSGFRQIIEKSLNSSDAIKYFSYQNFDISGLLICLGYGNEIAAISKKMLENEPNTEVAKRSIIENLVFSGDYAKAIEEADAFGIGTEETGINIYKMFAMYQLDMLDEVDEIISKMDSLKATAYYDLKAMVLVKKGMLAEAKRLMSIERRRRPTYLVAIEAVYGRQTANKEAHLLDQKMLLDFPLFRGYHLLPKNPPFDFSATPNFAKKLGQVGIQVDSR